MLDLKQITLSSETIKQSLNKRGALHLIPVLQEVVEKDRKRKLLIQDVETLKKTRNEASQEIAKLKSQGSDATKLLEKMKEVSLQIKTLDETLAETLSSINSLLLEFPNTLSDKVPPGKTADDNLEVRNYGQKRQFEFSPRTHDEMGEKMGLLDFKKAGEVSGARFVFLKGRLAALSRALVQFMISEHVASGYEEILPPFLVNRKSLTGTGQLPKFEADVFHVASHDLFLVPTAEVPVTNYHAGDILRGSELPKSYVAYSPCFRSEAGSYGKDTKGLKRQHQFEKVELVKFVTPEQAELELESLLKNAESILQKLELPYRVMLLCGGDTGFHSAKTYDIEVWCPGTQSYMEISSCSHFGDFQSRRANIRYRSEASQKVQFVHTLNGSGLAIGRTLIAILENYQTEEGDFDIPNALSPWLSSNSHR